MRAHLERLEQYLDVLARFGYGDRASIVAFHPGYAAVTTWSLDKLLTVAGPLNDQAAAPDVASWAVRVHRRGNAESLEYLVDYPILHVVRNETAGMPLRSLLEAATQAGPTFLRQCDRQGLRYGLTPFFVYSEMPAYLAQSRFSRLWSQLYSEVQLH